MNYQQKYLKYKTKYFELKNQFGGEPDLYFYITKKEEDGDIVEDYFKLENIEKKSITYRGNEIFYENNLIYKKLTDEFYIKIYNLFETNKIAFEIFISSTFDTIKLNLYKVEQDTEIHLIEIVFSSISDLNKDFKGNYNIHNISLFDFFINKIREELNLISTTDIPQIILTQFNINIEFNNFDEFVKKCYDLFLRDFYRNFYKFNYLRDKVRQELSGCKADKRFLEFITSHYLHQLYYETGLLGSEITNFLVSKPGFGILSRIITDKIKKNIDLTNSLCSKKLLYYDNLIKYLQTKLNLDEVLIKNKSGVFVSLPSSIEYTKDGVKHNVTNINIKLDSGNESQTIIGIAIINHLGFEIKDLTKCSVTGCGIGGEIKYNKKFILTIKFNYYNKEFTFPCLVDEEPTSINKNTILFGWDGFLDQITNQGYAIYGHR